MKSTFHAGLGALLAVLVAACGGGGGGSNGDSSTPKSASLEMFAGTWGPAAFVDGTGTQANFYAISDMAFDAEGNVLVLDSALRKVTPAAQVSTLSALFPFSVIAVDNSSQAYVGEYQFGPCRLGECPFGGSIRRLAANGTTSPVTPATSSDGTGTFALSLASLVAANGDLFWADVQSQAIRRLSAAGDLTMVAGIPGSIGNEDGPARSARFNFPQGLAVDRSGNLYVADSSNHAIRKISAGVVTTVAGSPGIAGSDDGVGLAARFSNPVGIALDDMGNLYVADAGNCTVRKITPAAMVTTLAGSVGACGVFMGGALPGALHYPRRVAVKGDDLYISMRNGIAVLRNRP